ncbi:MAG: trypsin-like peptidase domain-containing protein [Anaerolineae bacterium]|nr:trypsin-like peptidase domain-containing protein [Anaerolineae bacterium]
MSRLTLAPLLAILITALGTQITLAQQTFDLERIERATVFVMQAVDVQDNLQITCIGSGTIVSRSGLILTNAHNTLPSDDCIGETLVIAFNVRSDEAPIPKYRAEIAQADAGLDLALLRITRQLDGRLIDPGDLALPFVELADSAFVDLDQTITVVGYPGIGNDPVDVARGTVSGFVAEPRSGEKSWIKTLAEIPGTMTGGGAYDQRGQLIGIPTTAPLSRISSGTTCSPIQDTNGDGLVNTSDICIPVGGFINALRPSNFARPLLRAASLELSVDTPTDTGVRFSGAGTPTFSRLFFSPSVNEAGMPTSVIDNLPAGSNSLYLFFDYRNMTPETVYELRVTTDGIPNPTFSLAPVRWSGGEDGMWYIGSSNQPWPNGIYDFTLFANGIAAGNARIVIGGAAEPEPLFSDIVFGLRDNRGTPLGNGFVLPTGNIANARFIYRNMTDGAAWTVIWYFNGTELTRTQDIWSDGPGGAKTIGLEGSGGLFPGNYRLELYLENVLTATSDFIIAGAQQGAFPQVFQDAHFVTANTIEEAITAVPISSFPNTISTLYGLFDWQQIAPGTLWTLRISVDDVVFFDQTAPWSSPETGLNFLVRVNGEQTIPDGSYSMELLVNNVPLALATAQVGIGQLPIDRFAQASGIQLRGLIVDAETGQGIPGISFILLSEEYSVVDFEWRQDQIFASATTDSEGRFQMDRPLDYDTPYSVIVSAYGYLPMTADGFELTIDSPNPYDVYIPLTRG